VAVIVRVDMTMRVTHLSAHTRVIVMIVGVQMIVDVRGPVFVHVRGVFADMLVGIIVAPGMRVLVGIMSVHFVSMLQPI
jgi:hypothetical protein